MTLVSTVVNLAVEKKSLNAPSQSSHPWWGEENRIKFSHTAFPESFLFLWWNPDSADQTFPLQSEHIGGWNGGKFSSDSYLKVHLQCS